MIGNRVSPGDLLTCRDTGATFQVDRVTPRSVFYSGKHGFGKCDPAIIADEFDVNLDDEASQGPAFS
jgi:hypothetical protein